MVSTPITLHSVILVLWKGLWRSSVASMLTPSCKLGTCRTALSTSWPAMRCSAAWAAGLRPGRPSSSSAKWTAASRCGTCWSSITDPYRSTRTSPTAKSPAWKPLLPLVSLRPLIVIICLDLDVLKLVWLHLSIYFCIWPPAKHYLAVADDQAIVRVLEIPKQLSTPSRSEVRHCNTLLWNHFKED